MAHVNADGYNHAHGYVRVRFHGTFGALVALIVSKLHLPMRLVVASGTLPHDPECTPGPDGVGVTRSVIDG